MAIYHQLRVSAYQLAARITSCLPTIRELSRGGSSPNAEWQGFCRVLVPERVLSVRSSGQLCEVLMGAHVEDYRSFAYSALAFFGIRTSGSASFQGLALLGQVRLGRI